MPSERSGTAGSSSDAGCGVACTTYTGTIAGDTVGYTWQTSGRYEARLTAIDSEGRTATTTLIVPVADVAPVLTLDPPPPAARAPGSRSRSWRRSTTPGPWTTRPSHVDWGDGTPPVTSGRGPQRGLPGHARPPRGLHPERRRHHPGHDHRHPRLHPARHLPGADHRHQPGRTDRPPDPHPRRQREQVSRPRAPRRARPRSRSRALGPTSR